MRFAIIRLMGHTMHEDAVADVERSVAYLLAARAEAEEAQACAQAAPQTILPYNTPTPKPAKRSLHLPPLDLQSPNPRVSDESAPAPLGLRLRTGQRTADYALVRAVTLIGRGEGMPSEVDVPVDGGDGVSRRHAALLRRHGQLLVADTGSTNGTWLNGRRLEPYREASLHRGDCIRLGERTELTVI